MIVTVTHPGDRHYRNTTIRISDLVVTTYGIEDVTFENCVIMGPAVLLPLEGVVFNECGFDAPGAEWIIWRIDAGRPGVTGAIGLNRCEFHSCRFVGIGIAANDEFYQQAIAGIEPAD